jgi:hypothetical protein
MSDSINDAYGGSKSLCDDCKIRKDCDYKYKDENIVIKCISYIKKVK